MQHLQDETEALLSGSAEDFLAQEHSTERLRDVYTGSTAYRREFWRQLAQQGWLALRLPEARGGSELHARHIALLAEAFGRHNVPEPLVACAMMPSVLAADLPPHDGWAPILEGLQDGSHVATLAWQDDAQAIGPAPRATRARRHADGYVLDGIKHCVPAFSFADSLLVTAELDGVPALFVAPRDSAGVHAEESLTSDGGSVAKVSLRGVRLPESALLAQGDAVTAALAVAIAEATLAATALLIGLARKGLELTLEYLRTRVQFGRQIGSFQSLQHLAVDVRIQQALALGSYRSALARYEAAPALPATRAAIAAAKARASDAAIAAGRFGVQAHGAIGFAAEADIGLYLKSALRWAAYLGNASLQRDLFAQITSEDGVEA